MDHYKRQFLNKSEQVREKLKDTGEHVKEKLNNVSQNMNEMRSTIKNEGKIYFIVFSCLNFIPFGPWSFLEVVFS